MPKPPPTERDRNMFFLAILKAHGVIRPPLPPRSDRRYWRKVYRELKKIKEST